MQPQKYERTTDFTERDGDDTDHASINAEFDAAALTTDQIRENLALIQRDDGALKNGIVTADALDDTVFDAVLINVNVAVNDAQTSASSALTSATTALAARDVTLAAKSTTETARDVTILNANNASASALAALNSQTAAASSQSDANASKVASASSQVAAAASATSASTSATTATIQASNSGTSAAASLASQNAASDSAGTATTQANAAAASYDAFDDRYLGAKSAAPTVDNDGAALLVGALYWDTAIPGMRAYTGTAWTTLPAAMAGAVANTPSGNIAATTVQGAINELDAEKAIAANFTNVNNTADANKPVSTPQQNALDLKANALQATRSLFSKADTQSVVFAKTGAGTAQLKAGTYIDVNGTLVTFASATTIVMPSLANGTDYAIYACTNGTVRADASFSAPSGYTTATSRKIGGFHYAPGGNATANAGGDTTPAINQFSFWDLKFKPACQDPRGMALVADGFWADIYLMGVDHLTNGTSKYNVTIADGSSPPKIPTKFGGNGSNAYGSLNWWEAAEVLAHHGKRPPSYSEFAALAYGTTEASSGGTDPGSTILRAAYTSKWGVMLATGNLWQWGAEFGGGAAGAAWTANTGGRGSTYQMENAAVFGGSWGDTSVSGSRCSLWGNSPVNSSSSAFSSRGVCDPLILE